MHSFFSERFSCELSFPLDASICLINICLNCDLVRQGNIWDVFRAIIQVDGNMESCLNTSNFSSNSSEM